MMPDFPTRIDLWSLILGILGTIVSGVILKIMGDRLRYRSQRRLFLIQRMTPTLEKMLGQVVTMSDLADLYERVKGYAMSRPVSESRGLEDLVRRIREESQKKLIETANELATASSDYVCIYSEFKKSGLIQTVRSQDEVLIRFLDSVFEVARTFCNQKVASFEDSYGLGILVANTSFCCKRTEDRLKRFLSV